MYWCLLVSVRCLSVYVCYALRVVCCLLFLELLLLCVVYYLLFAVHMFDCDLSFAACCLMRVAC